MNSRIERIKQRIEPLKEAIVNHKLYSVIHNIGDVRIFMQHHVFAVWDFMSLLKTLQNNLTCTTVPWFPRGDAETRFLINEIVAGEESDVDLEGKRTSHFELYLQAMEQCGADTELITKFIQQLKNTGDLGTSFTLANVPKAASTFVQFTFETIESNKSHLQAAVFCFGREDLIPSMFHSIVSDLGKASPERISIFKYYLERHIEVDGGHHSELALQMTTNLCGSNEQYWEEAETAVLESLRKRIELWDGAYEQIIAQQK